MHFTKKNSTEKRIELKNKLKEKKILRFPGAYNPLTAKLIAEIGFDGIYISGGVMSNDLGMPDIGLTTLKEVSYRGDTNKWSGTSNKYRSNHKIFFTRKKSSCSCKSYVPGFRIDELKKCSFKKFKRSTSFLIIIR